MPDRPPAHRVATHPDRASLVFTPMNASEPQGRKTRALIEESVAGVMDNLLSRDDACPIPVCA